MRVSTKTASEMLVRRRQETLVNVYSLVVDVTLVKSSKKKQTETRIPQKWLQVTNPKPKLNPYWYHQRWNWDQLYYTRIVGIPGAKRTIYFVRIVGSFTYEKSIRSTIKTYSKCRVIDASLICWKKRKLVISRMWHKFVLGIIHYGGTYFLSLIDCGTTRFTIGLYPQDFATVMRQSKALFLDRSPPTPIKF